MRYLLGALLAVDIATAVAQAQTSTPQYDPAAPGQARALSIAPAPAGIAVRVVAMDDSAASLRVGATIAQALAARLVALSDSPSAYVMRFATEVIETGRPSPAPSLGEVRGNHRDRQVRINLWSTTQDSVFQGRQPERAGRAGVRHVLSLSLAEPGGGRRIWTGEATYDGVAGDDLATYRGLADILSEHLGQSVRGRSFALD